MENISTLSSPQAKEILTPHFNTLNKVMNESLEDLNRALSTLTETTNKRAKSALLHSIAIEKAKKYFDKNPDVVIKSKYQSIQIIFSNKIVGRIKKIDKNNKSTNIRTRRNSAILMQQTSLFDDLIIQNVAPSVFVDLGYNITESGDEFEKLNIICRKNNSIEWHFSFKEDEELNVLPSEQNDSLNIKEETQITIKKAK